MDIKEYLEQLLKKTNEAREEGKTRMQQYTTPELDELAMSAGTMSGGLGNVAAKVAPSVGRTVGKKLVDFLEPKVTEAGIPEMWVDSAKIPFQGLRRYLQKSVGSGAMTPESQALHSRIGDTVAKSENAALRANQIKPKISDEQLAFDRFRVDKQVEADRLKRLDKVLEDAQRTRSASEVTIPGIDELTKIKKK